jgi:hypothetical protein
LHFTQWHYSQSSESSSIGNQSMCRLGVAVVLRSACKPAAVKFSHSSREVSVRRLRKASRAWFVTLE